MVAVMGGEGTGRGEPTWQANPQVAWVDGEDRVALVNLDDPAATLPVLCPEPAAALWRAVTTRPLTTGELATIASTMVGERSQALVEAFVEAFASAGLLVR